MVVLMHNYVKNDLAAAGLYTSAAAHNKLTKTSKDLTVSRQGDRPYLILQLVLYLAVEGKQVNMFLIVITFC